MGIKSLSSRAIRGSIFNELEASMNGSWAFQLAMYETTDQDSETYEIVGQVPRMQAKVGAPGAKQLHVEEYTITNADYEAALLIPEKWFRRDKTGRVNQRVQEFGRAGGADHFESLLTTLLIAGESTDCSDGEYFFDDDHASAGAEYTTAQSNDISVDISELSCTVHGSETAPSDEEAMLALFEAITTMLGLKDDRGRGVNGQMKNVLVMAPATPIWMALQSVVTSPTLNSGRTNVLRNSDFNISLMCNPDLTWTTKFAVFRLDGSAKPLIMQDEFAPKLIEYGESSDFFKDEDAYKYVLKASRAVGYGDWRKACLVTLA